MGQEQRELQLCLKLLCDYISIIFGEGAGTPLQYSCLENPMDRGAWQSAIHGVAKNRTRRATSLSLLTFMHWRRKWQPIPVFLPGESQGRGSLVDCCLWGHTKSDMTEVTQQQPVFLRGEFHVQGSLAGYSPWGRKVSDMTERLCPRVRAHTHTHTHTHNNVKKKKTRKFS